MFVIPKLKALDMKKLSFLFVLIANFAFGQKIKNDLHGYYKAESDTLLYSYFAFDGNGKVDITGFGKGDYFQKGDSLIIYPDKSIFKFKIEKNKLKGTSDWVKNGTWIKKDTLIENRRKDPALAQKRAELLAEYYQKNKDNTDFSLLFDEAKIKEHNHFINDLCTKGLPKACIEIFGMKVMDDMGGISAVLSGKINKNIAENPEIVALGNKIVEMGEEEGHTILGRYYYAIGQKEKANTEWDKAIEKGSMRASMAQLEVELEESAAQAKKTSSGKKKKPIPQKKKK